MNKNVLLPLLLFVVICLSCALPSRLLADYYRYTDSRGIVHMTNRLDSVPQKFRASMRVIREEPKKEAAGQAAPALDSASESVSAPQEASEQKQGLFAQLASRHVWVKPLAVVAAITLLFLAVLKLASWLSSPMLSRVIYISFFAGVMVFLYKSYVTYLVDGSMKLKDRAVIMMKKASNREVPEGGGAAPYGTSLPSAVPSSENMNRQ
ncbi:DUF4124 domain-containing protein [Geomonas oryzae]|uniref:DUF4124 domain-containing protein n=1 Tax=Geomonas oryzae TaxID=2364273 RepID=UPI00100BA643|nr:DUF4124 domain-containing protein [Geomonas oryzae]